MFCSRVFGCQTRTSCASVQFCQRLTNVFEFDFGSYAWTLFSPKCYEPYCWKTLLKVKDVSVWEWVWVSECVSVWECVSECVCVSVWAIPGDWTQGIVPQGPWSLILNSFYLFLISQDIHVHRFKTKSQPGVGHIPKIPLLRRLRQQNAKFQASLTILKKNSFPALFLCSHSPGLSLPHANQYYPTIIQKGWELINYKY
jgi:hypothetical protein